jgi:hypothetical protein
VDADHLAPLFYGVGYPVIIVFFVVLWVRLNRLQARLRQGDLLESLARELDLPVSRDPSAPMPFLKLEVGGLRAYFSLWPFGSSSMRVISMLEIRVGCEGFFEATSRRGHRGPTVTTRITAIDTFSGYSIMTSQPSWARRILERDWMSALSGLEATLRAPLRLQLTPSRVTIEAERLLDGPALRALLEGAGRLLDLLHLSATTEGVDILDSTHSAETGRCPVCGVRAEPAVACGACHTPHHADCWAYLGRCGIFGCGGRPVSA